MLDTGCKQLIIGLGTGRCGTVSLSELLNAQKHSQISHECRPLLSWWGGVCGYKGHLNVLENRLVRILSRDAQFVGDVAFFYLPYLRHIQKLVPTAKFVEIYRPMREVVKSYMEWTKGRNHWMNHDGTIWRHDPEWDVCYPKYACDDKEAAVRAYYDEYNRESSLWGTQNPESSFSLPMVHLNEPYRLEALLTFCGFLRMDHVLKVVNANSQIYTK